MFVVFVHPGGGESPVEDHPQGLMRSSGNHSPPGTSWLIKDLGVKGALGTKDAYPDAGHRHHSCKP